MNGDLEGTAGMVNHVEQNMQIPQDVILNQAGTAAVQS